MENIESRTLNSVIGGVLLNQMVNTPFSTKELKRILRKLAHDNLENLLSKMKCSIMRTGQTQIYQPKMAALLSRLNEKRLAEIR